MRKLLLGAVVTVIAMVTVQVLGAGAVATPQSVAPTLQTINGRVSALVLSDGRLFVGGQMTVPFTRLGAVDPASGAVVWAPTDVPSEARALATLGGALFVGGDFGIRVYSTTTFALLTAITCGQVRAIEPDLAGTGVFVGGSFTTCGGQAHKNLARIDLAGFAVSAPWAPKVDGTVLSLAADPTGVFVGGSFGTINQTARFRLAKITLAGDLDPWSSSYVPNAGDVGASKSVRALDVAAGKVFASWGESVNKTVIYDQATAAFIRYWGTDGDTQAVFADGGNIYLGGHWNQFVGPTASVHFAAFDASTLNKEAVVDPIPLSPMGVFTIISDGAGGLWLGGDVVGNWGLAAVKVKRLVHLVPTTAIPPTTTTTQPTTTTTQPTTTTTQPTTTTTQPTTVDTQDPRSFVATPAAKSTVSSPVAFSGNATDDVSVTRVRIAIRNSVTTLWLQANGTWGSTIAQFDATLSSPGPSATGWTWVTALPAGSYYIQSKAVDASGKVETTTNPWVAFTVA